MINLFPYIDEITQKCIDNCGAIPHIIESRDNNNNFKKLTKLSNKNTWKIGINLILI